MLLGTDGQAYSKHQIMDRLAAASTKDIQRLAGRTPNSSDGITGIV